jgi:hypothetical protein
LSRAAFAASVVVHVVAGYALSRQDFSGSLPQPPQPLAEFFLFEAPRPAPAAPAPVQEPEPAPPDAREPPLPAPPPPAPVPTPRAAEPVAPPATVVVPAEVEPAPPPVVPPPSSADLMNARERAAQDVVSERSTEDEYLTFSIDDVAVPRPEPEPDVPSIFDGGAGGSRGPSVGQVGQSRTKFGHRMSSLCNALTGGFSLLGWGSFCGGPPDGGPSGLFPEVRPDYLDLMPECVDTRDTAPALALEAPFPTIKCRLVKQVDPEVQP